MVKTAAIVLRPRCSLPVAVAAALIATAILSPAAASAAALAPRICFSSFAAFRRSAPLPPLLGYPPAPSLRAGVAPATGGVAAFLHLRRSRSYASARPASFYSLRGGSLEARGGGARGPEMAGRILGSPSAERNKGPIWVVLSSRVLPSVAPASKPCGVGGRSPLTVVEVAAGCGVHTLHFATNLLSLLRSRGGGRPVTWHPTDPDPRCRNSVDARVALVAESNPEVGGAIRPAVSLTLDKDGVVEGRDADTEDPTEGLEAGVDLMVCINMIHISPWGATLGLMRAAGRLLRDGGVLYCYGPYKVGGTAVQSNLDFDASLRSRDPSWGVRDLEEVASVAERLGGLNLVETVGMPANNLSVVFRKGG